MKVLLVSSTEKELTRGNLTHCLISAKLLRKNTRTAVIIESDNGKRLTMARQDAICKRLRLE